MKRALFCVSILAVLILVTLPAYSEPAEPSASLMQNGGFESGSLDPWAHCGGVQLADTQAGAGRLEVHSGRYALRMGGPTNGQCGDYLQPQLIAEYQNITIPADAENVTLGFWYSRVGNFGEGSSFWDLTINMIPADGGSSPYPFMHIDADETAGWNYAHYELDPANVPAVRGRTFTLRLQVYFDLSADHDLAYYLDEFEMVTETVRLPLQPNLPAGLQDDNTQPLIGLGIVDGKLRTVRTDIDGSNKTVLYAGPLDNGATEAKWSSDGQKISVIDLMLQREPNETPNTNWARISTLTLMQPDGSQQQELFRTLGQKIIPGNPPGCRPPSNCVTYERPALDVEIYSHDWSPDSSKIAIQYCTRQRYSDGYSTDPICYIDTVDVATGETERLVELAEFVSWSPQNKILYRVNIDGPLVYNVNKGIYELDLSVDPPVTTLLFYHKSKVDTQEDSAPTWSHDGNSFMTLRFIAGNHFDPQGQNRSNPAMMRFDPNAPANPLQTVLVDFGYSLSSPAPTNSEQYWLYSVLKTGGWYSYWHDIKSGETGFLTEEIVFVDHRPTAGPSMPTLTRDFYLPLTVKGP